MVLHDNLGAESTSRTNKNTPRARHMDVNFHLVRSWFANSVVDVKYVKTSIQKADILTKSLSAHSLVQAASFCYVTERLPFSKSGNKSKGYNGARIEVDGGVMLLTIFKQFC